MNKEKGQGGDSSQGPKETWRWSEEMDYLLITAVVDEARKGLRVDGSWVLEKTLKDKWREAYDMFNGLNGFTWSPMTKKFEVEDEVWEELIRKGLTSRQVHNVLDKDKQPIDLNDAFDNTTMNDLEVGNFDEVQFSTPNVDSFSPENAQSNQSTGTSVSRGIKRKASMVDMIES
ncbi:hypothetical protein SESBI_28121 [Sesbania bispinosa]|nr:hypothetical protein SESBI_28121 [Sesbania bispinosa]